MSWFDKLLVKQVKRECKKIKNIPNKWFDSLYCLTNEAAEMLEADGYDVQYNYRERAYRVQPPPEKLSAGQAAIISEIHAEKKIFAEILNDICEATRKGLYEIMAVHIPNKNTQEELIRMGYSVDIKKGNYGSMTCTISWREDGD